MGSILKHNGSKWRVFIRHKGFKSITRVFDDYDEAKKFHDKIEYILKAKINCNKEKRILDMLSSMNSIVDK